MGKIISLSGIDGAGKSTQVELLENFLKGKRKKFKVTQDLFGYFLLKPVIRILRGATNSPSEGPVTRNKKGIAKLWFILAFLDIWIGYIFRIQPMFEKYEFIIADRSYVDIWANLLYYGYLPEWAFAPFIKLLPHTDISYMLDVKPENGKKRSDDFPLAYFKDQARIYKRLTLYQKFYIIDVNQDKKKINKKIIEVLVHSAILNTN